MNEKQEIISKSFIRLSPTSVNCFRRCAREFYYTYIAKLPQPSNINLIKGNVIHKTLEVFFKSNYDDELQTKLIKIFEDKWKENEKKIVELKLSQEETEKEKNDCLNMLDMFIKTFIAKMEYQLWAGKAKDNSHAFNILRPKFREKFYESKELNLCGFIDRVHTDQSGIITVGDYKTSSRFGIGIKDEYDVQCAIYALLYKMCEGVVPDYTSIIYIRFGEEVRTRVTPDQIKNAIEIVRTVNSKTTTNNIDDYPLSEGGLCKWCPYFDKCSGIENFNSEVRQQVLLDRIKKNKQKVLPDFGLENPVKRKEIEVKE
jgi:RecB family exonuclease